MNKNKEPGHASCHRSLCLIQGVLAAANRSPRSCEPQMRFKSRVPGCWRSCEPEPSQLRPTLCHKKKGKNFHTQKQIHKNTIKTSKSNLVMGCLPHSSKL